jgi:Ca2+-binding EF-hand superfamily protein
MREKFRELDKNKSGDLDYGELKQLLISECALDDNMARSLVDDCDINKDGKISLAEFQNLWILLFNSND